MARIDVTFTVSGFSLEIGNNYGAVQFFACLVKQRPEVVEMLYTHGLRHSDMVVFKYKGSFCDHEDKFAACDAFDHIREKAQ